MAAKQRDAIVCGGVRDDVLHGAEILWYTCSGRASAAELISEAGQRELSAVWVAAVESPALGGAADSTLALETEQGIAEALVVDAQVAAEGGARQGVGSISEALSEKIDQGRLGDIAGARRCVAGADAQMGASRVIGHELDGEGVGGWSAAMLEGELESVALRTR